MDMLVTLFAAFLGITLAYHSANLEEQYLVAQWVERNAWLIVASATVAVAVATVTRT